MFTTQTASSWRPDQNVCKLSRVLDTRQPLTDTIRGSLNFQPSLAVAALLLAACAPHAINREVSTPLDMQSRSFASFRDPEGITAIPTVSLKDPIVRAHTKYPSELESRQISGAAVVAFVIDTTGSVEPGTVTFLNGPRHEFAAAVCDGLPKSRYPPFVIEGRKRRVLIVQMHAFLSQQYPDPSVVPDALSLRSRIEEEFAVTPIVTVIDRLKELPHCEVRQR